jgi:hypothetical protein
MNLHFFLFDRLHRVLGISEGPSAQIGSDCSVPGLSVVGNETILKYQTTMQRGVYEDGSRYTEWRAPQLDCIVMKYTKEELRNGELKLTDERRAIQVQINRAQ